MTLERRALFKVKYMLKKTRQKRPLVPGLNYRRGAELAQNCTEYSSVLFLLLLISLLSWWGCSWMGHMDQYVGRNQVLD